MQNATITIPYNDFQKFQLEKQALENDARRLKHWTQHLEETMGELLAAMDCLDEDRRNRAMYNAQNALERSRRSFHEWLRSSPYMKG